MAQWLWLTIQSFDVSDPFTMDSWCFICPKKWPDYSPLVPQAMGAKAGISTDFTQTLLKCDLQWMGSLDISSPETIWNHGKMTQISPVLRQDCSVQPIPGDLWSLFGSCWLPSCPENPPAGSAPAVPLLRKRVPFGHKRRHIPTGSHWHAGNKMLILPKNSATVLLPQGGFLTLLLNVGNGGNGMLV